MSNGVSTKTVAVNFLGITGQEQQTAIYDPIISQTIIMSDAKAEALGYQILDKNRIFTRSENFQTQERIGLIVVNGQPRGLIINTVPQNIPTFIGKRFFDL